MMNINLFRPAFLSALVSSMSSECRESNNTTNRIKAITENNGPNWRPKVTHSYSYKKSHSLQHLLAYALLSPCGNCLTFHYPTIMILILFCHLVHNIFAD